MFKNSKEAAIVYVLNRDMPQKIRWKHHFWSLRVKYLEEGGGRFVLTSNYLADTVRQYEAVVVSRGRNDFDFNIESEMRELAEEINKKIDKAMHSPILKAGSKLTGDDT